MDDDRSKRLGKLLESANELEARQRRNNITSAIWGGLIVLLLVGLFFAGRAFYSGSLEVGGKNQGGMGEITAESMTPGPTPAVKFQNTVQKRALPDKVQLTAPAELHVKRGGKVVAVVYLKAGDTVQPIGRDGGKLAVKWRDAEGMVQVSDTTLDKTASE